MSLALFFENRPNKMATTSVLMHGHVAQVAPEPGGDETTSTGHHRHHTAGVTAHFADIDDRLSNAIEAGSELTTTGAPSGGGPGDKDRSHSTRFHISHKAPSRKDFVDSLRDNARAKKQMKNVRIFGARARSLRCVCVRARRCGGGCRCGFGVPRRAALVA